MIWSLFIFPSHPTQELASIVCNDDQGDLFHSVGPHRNQCSPQPTQEKLMRFWKKKGGEWTGRVEISKEEIPGSKHSIYGYILTYSRRTFKLCVLTKWDFNFCVHSSPLQDIEDRWVPNLHVTLPWPAPLWRVRCLCRWQGRWDD